MGEARRKRLADKAHGLEVIDGGKTLPPPTRLIQSRITMPKDLDSGVDDRFKFLNGMYRTRNDFLVALIMTGVRELDTLIKRKQDEVQKTLEKTEAEKPPAPDQV